MSLDGSQLTGSSEPQWGQVVRTALTERGVSAGAAAVELGVSPASVSAWLKGYTEPPLDHLRALCRLAGVPFPYVLALAGRVPADFASPVAFMAVESASRSALADLKRWTDVASQLLSQPPAAVLAGAIVDRCPDWQPTLRPRLRGRRNRCRAQTYVGLVPVSSDSAIDFDRARDHLEQVVGDIINSVGAVWRLQHQLDDWPASPPLVLTVLDQERSRAPSLARGSETYGVGVVGLPYAHAELVASVIADQLGFGLINPLDLAQRRFGLRRDNDPHRVGMSQVLGEVLGGALDSLRYVWTCAEPEVLEAIDLETWQGPLVHVRCGPRMQAEGAQFWGYENKRLTRLRHALDRLSVKSTVLSFDLDDAPLFKGAQLDRDELFDASWDIGLAAAKRVREYASA